MKRPIYKLLKPFIDELRNKTFEFYKDRLVSLVIFGSYVQGNVSLSSDLDLLIILKNAPLKNIERCREFWNNVEDKIKAKTRLYVSSWIRTGEEARIFSNLYIAIYESNIVLYDENVFFGNIIDKIREYFDQGLIERKILKGKIYWRVKNEQKVGGRLF